MQFTLKYQKPFRERGNLHKNILNRKWQGRIKILYNILSTSDILWNKYRTVFHCKKMQRAWI